MQILLKNATYINWETLEFTNTNILVNEGVGGSIQLVSNLENVDNSKISETIDCSGKLVTKSFAVGHHHAYSALAKGMPAPKKNPVNFYEILQYVWWTLDKCLDKETVELSALVTAMACAKAGSTFVIDHHASPNYIKGSLELMAKAFDKVGVNHLLCYEITDRDGLDKAQQGLQETEDYLKNRQGLVGLHASFTVGDETLKSAVDLMKKYNSGAHVHLAEDLYDQEHCVSTYGKRVTQRYSDAGILDFSKTILVHCLHLEDAERNLIEKSSCWLAQNAESNMNNNVGYFNGNGLGNNIMMGTDGMHSDMLQSAKAAFFVGQRFDNIDYPSSYQRFRNVHRYLSQNKFTGDGENNLVVLDYSTATEINQNNFLGHFIFGLKSEHVQHVISNGKLIVKDRKITTVNEEEIHQLSQKHGKRLWELMSK
ncbi:MAG TPA: amidohydrolase family protein [Tenuifilaceae bacterium]|nr:amidohydrolase family protein [Tenuifilaceae bacterium]HPE17183.1 amidohydrolase family protein [Tenuifilaceae bacterium]HPJ44769.1 amidohydrolase family protein [Tenuifilaceae bacterium]HPQ33295.1 amidohydrolase family protein [Tenuifilaceae bacterium]HRX67581.1 amidohydrolase family protein [Tenuifilaceae bacterium]